MERRQVVFLAIFVIIFLILAGGLSVANIIFARHTPGGSGIFVPWMGARVFFTERSNPYSLKAATAVQIFIYGHPAEEGEYPIRFIDPFYVLVLMFPFAFIRDHVVVRGLWLVISEAALIALLLISRKLTEWRPWRLSFFLYFLFGLFGFYSLYSLVQGSMAIIFALSIAAILFSLWKGMDEIAGVLLALISYRWEISGLFLLCVLIWTISQRRFRVVIMYFMVLVVLLAIATMILPSWPLSFLRAVMANFHNFQGWTPGESFQEWWPTTGSKLGWILTMTILGILILEWRAMRDTNFQRFLWVSCLTLSVTPLTGIPTNPANYPILLIPLTLFISLLENRWTSIGRWYTAFILVVLTSLWAVYMREGVFTNNFSKTIILLPLPIFLTISLYWVRWWGTNPPKTWVDQISEHKVI